MQQLLGDDSQAQLYTWGISKNDALTPTPDNKIRIDPCDGAWGLIAHIGLKPLHLGGSDRNSCRLCPSLGDIGAFSDFLSILLESIGIERRSRQKDVARTPSHHLSFHAIISPLLCVKGSSGIFGTLLPASGSTHFPWSISLVYQGP